MNPSPIQPGRVVQQYRLESLLGEGGMGTVFLATDTQLERPVAVKMLHPHLLSQGPFMERFRHEALILARLNHPNIAVLYSLLREGTDHFMVMEYVEGKNLESLIRTGGALAPATAAEIVRQGLEGLFHAHRKGVLHRDLKPANLMLTPEGLIKLMDFGIARVAGEQRLTQVNRVVGTLEYMAPELLQGGEPSVASDLYAMGVLLYELLSGRVPFTARTDYELIQCIIEKKPVPLRKVNEQIPRELEAIVQRALDKNPALRFADAKEFQKALQPFFADAPLLDPNRLGTPPPATDVLDIQPRRPDRLARLRSPRLPVTSLTRTGGTALRWVRENRHLVATTVLLALALVFVGLIWLDASTEPVPTGQTVDDSLKNGLTTQVLLQQKTTEPPTEAEEPQRDSVRQTKPTSPRISAPPTGGYGAVPTPRPITSAPRGTAPPVGKKEETPSVPPTEPKETPSEPVTVLPSTPEPVTRSAAALKRVTVRRLPVSLELTETISSAEAREGQTVRLRVTQAVLSEGVVVIQAGATALGEVTRVKRAGDDLFRKKDLLELHIRSVEAVNGQRIPLRQATLSEEAKGGPVVFRSGQTFEVRTSDGLVLSL